MFFLISTKDAIVLRDMAFDSELGVSGVRHGSRSSTASQANCTIIQTIDRGIIRAFCLAVTFFSSFVYTHWQTVKFLRYHAESWGRLSLLVGGPKDGSPEVRARSYLFN